MVGPLSIKARATTSRGKLFFLFRFRAEISGRCHALPQTRHFLLSCMMGRRLRQLCRHTTMDEPPLPPSVEACLRDLAAGEDKARERLLELCSERLRLLAHRMLRRFPAVRRWEETDDVFQNAAMRLYRCLGEVSVESPRDVLALAATQIHRELIDMARHHSGPMAFGSNHATGVQSLEDHSNIRHPADTASESHTEIDRWTAFHEAIDQLPEIQREVFQLVWYLGADQQSIAELHNCSVRTVKTRWREAREAVKMALDELPPS